MMKTTLQAEPVLAHPCELGEGPLWDEASQAIYWLDIEQGQIHAFSAQTKAFNTIDVYQRIGCIAFRERSNEFIAGLQNGFATIDRSNGAVTIVADPEKHLTGNRFNDGKCDPAGRFWAGTMSLNEETGAGNLYVLDYDRTVKKKMEGVTISNGMAWNADKTIFYYIDTPTKMITSWNYNNDSGDITNKRTIFSIADAEGYPDGMTIDNEGMLWVAHWGGWQVSRWDPASGTKLLSISLPVSRVTSCTFGGRNLDDLYITTAKTGMSENDLQREPHAGKLFVVRNCGYRGLPPVSYRG